MPGDPRVSTPKYTGDGGAGAFGRTFKRFVGQAQSRKTIVVASGGGITAGVKGTVTLQDAGPVDSLQVDARLAGNHGNNIRVKTKRRTATNGDAVFDLTVIYPHPDLRAFDWRATFVAAAVNPTTDIVTVPQHGRKTGDIVQVRNSGGGLPGGLSANTPYWVIQLSVDTFAFASSESNAFAGTKVNLTTAGTGTQTVSACWIERFEAVSMVDAHKRYVETIVNAAPSAGGSELIAVTDLDSVTADQRPSDQGPTALSTGANEVTATGVTRGDHIESAINITDGTAVTSVWATKADTVVFGATIAASKNILLTVLSAQA
jgi:hypothetical protein